MDRIWKVVALLLAGGAIAVAVPWSWCLWAPPLPYVEPNDSARAWPLPVPEGWPRAVIKSRRADAVRTMIYTSSWSGLIEEHNLLNPQSRIAQSSSPHSQTVYTVGWPWRCLEGHSLSFPHRPFIETHQALRLRGSSPRQYRVLPWRPLWGTLLADSVFWGLLLAAVIAAPRLARRWFRVRRRLCPSCAYPAGASAVCSECGAHLSAPRARRTPSRS